MVDQGAAILEGLNEKQREAVVSDAKRLLVLQGLVRVKPKPCSKK